MRPGVWLLLLGRIGCAVANEEQKVGIELAYRMTQPIFELSRTHRPHGGAPSAFDGSSHYARSARDVVIRFDLITRLAHHSAYFEPLLPTTLAQSLSSLPTDS